MLTRFWFPLSRGVGIGVTASSDEEALRFAEDVRQEFFPDATIGRPIRDIDVSTLDAGHVLPNIGPSNVRGVWYPRLNI
jgi:hypothetical protein